MLIVVSYFDNTELHPELFSSQHSGETLEDCMWNFHESLFDKPKFVRLADGMRYVIAEGLKGVEAFIEIAKQDGFTISILEVKLENV